jgi:hypothetical protein
VVLFQEGFVRLTGQTSQAAVALSTLAIAGLFNPLRRGVQSWIDRRFYRPAYNAEQIVSSFARLAQDEADLGRLSSELVQVVRGTLQPTFVGLWMVQGKQRSKMES